VHGSPGCFGSGAIGEHLSAFQPLPPSFAHGMHFSPAGQFSFQMSHGSP
jgi:hypothetical protein